MFDVGFSELILVFVIGLVVLGPQRLPVAVKTVAGWIRAMRSLASNVQNELAQELKLQELQDSLKKVEEASKASLSPELQASMDELKKTAESMKRSYLGENEKADDEANALYHPQGNDAQSDTIATVEKQAGESVPTAGEIKHAEESDVKTTTAVTQSESATVPASASIPSTHTSDER